MLTRAMLSTGFRMLMAAVGLGLIAVIMAMNWSDRMVLPEGAYYNEAAAELVEVDEKRTVEIAERTEWTYRLNWPRGDREKSDDRVGLALSRSKVGGAGQPYVRAGMVTTLGRAEHWLLLAGLVLVGLTLPIQAWRWLGLMRCRGLRVGYFWTLRLTLVGQFFNVSMPGATGGDVLKACYAASKPGQRATAVMSVVVDRLAGLIGLVFLAGLAGLWAFDQPLIRWITLGIWVVLAMLAAGAWAYLSPKFRNRNPLGKMVERLPGRRFIQTVDEAAIAYRDHPRAVVTAVLISLCIHLTLVSSIVLAGQALGLEVPTWHLFALIPLVLVLASIPISPAGLGVMEGAAVLLIDAPPTEVLGMMLIFRLFQLAYALLGWATMLRGGITLNAPELARPGGVELSSA